MGIKWDPSLAVGIKVIDEQHQELFARVDALLGAMLQGRGKTEVAPVMDFLAAYVTEHFGNEERLMKQHAYPGAADHRTQHASFVSRIERIRSALEAAGPNPGMAVELNQLLGPWLREHIARTDRALGAFLAQRPGGVH